MNITEKDKDIKKNYDEILDNLSTKREQDINISGTKTKNSVLLINFLDSNKKKIWPSSTNIDCFWCCHPFDNFPFAIPIKYTYNKFEVYGNFCSPECASAYIFDSNNEGDEIWERYSLLNILYKKIVNNKHTNIKLAPPRIILKNFGGKLSVEEFRECNGDYNHDYKVTLPPMISIIPTMEETNYNISNKKKFVPIDKDRIYKANEDLRLRRSKPLPDAKNTLESCMRLKYV